jgi:nitrogen PTS system EIIA component
MLSELLSPGSILLSLKSATRDGVIGELLRAACFDRSVFPEESAFQALVEREISFSTAIGESTAVPHAKCGIREEMVMAVGLSRQGVDFSAADGKPVRLFFLMLTRKDVSGLHLKMLARIARLIKLPGFFQELFACASPVEALELLRRDETILG